VLRLGSDPSSAVAPATEALTLLHQKGNLARARQVQAFLDTLAAPSSE
jgi:hypothetical protein